MQAEKDQILLVEDEESLRDALKLNLELENYSVTAVDNGKKAIDTFIVALKESLEEISVSEQANQIKA